MSLMTYIFTSEGVTLLELEGDLEDLRQEGFPSPQAR